MKNKNIILIILIILLVSLFIGVIIVVSLNKEKNTSNKTDDILNNDGTFYKEVSLNKDFAQDIADKINSTYKYFDEKNLDKTDMSQNDYGLNCYRYTGNIDEAIEEITSLYIEPFHRNSFFKLLVDENDSSNKIFYSCIQDDCKLKKLSLDMIKMYRDQENSKILGFNNNTYYFNKENNNWKTKYSVQICEK